MSEILPGRSTGSRGVPEEVPDPKKSKNEENNSEWVFSGWMFASSPGLSAMDHPIYDVWVLECLGAEGEQTATAQGDGDGVTTDAAQPQEPKNFDSLLKGLTGHDSESAPADGENGETPAENSPDKAAGDQANTDPDGELQTPVAPDIGEENIPEPTPVDVEIIDDETQGLPPSGDE